MEEKNYKIDAEGDIGFLAVHFASKEGNIDVLRYLCEVQCADIEVGKRKGLDKGRTPLHYACANGDLNIVKYLIEV